jgi:hypothetical protein
MSHEPAGAFEEAVRVWQLGAAKKSDIHVRGEGVHVGKRRVADARRRLVIMYELPDVASAAAHGLEPPPRDRAKFVRLLEEPGVDGWISCD